MNSMAASLGGLVPLLFGLSCSDGAASDPRRGTGGGSGTGAASGAGTGAGNTSGGSGGQSGSGGTGAGSGGAAAAGNAGNAGTGGTSGSAGTGTSGGSGGLGGSAGTSGGAGGVGGASGSGGASAGTGGTGGAPDPALCQQIRDDYRAELDLQTECNPNSSAPCDDSAAIAPGCDCRVSIEPKDPFAIENLSNIVNDWFVADCSMPSCPGTCPTPMPAECRSDSTSSLGGRCMPR